MKNITILILIFNLFIAYPDDDGGKLDDAKKPEKSDGKSSPAPKNNDDDEMTAGEWLLLQIFVELFYQMAIHSPQVLFGDATDLKYTNYPYYGFTNGLYDKMSDKSFAGNLQISAARESSDLNSFNAYTSIYLGKYVSLDGSLTNYFENVNGSLNSLAISDFYLNMNRIRKEKFVFRYGIGLKTIFGDQTISGFSYKFGMDLFTFDPLSFSASYNGSFVNFIYYNELNLQLNYYLDRVYIFAGFDHFSTAGDIINPVGINQFKLGTGISF